MRGRSNGSAFDHRSPWFDSTLAKREFLWAQEMKILFLLRCGAYAQV